MPRERIALPGGKGDRTEPNPEVRKVREDLRSFLLEELPYLDDKKLENLTGKQLLAIYLDYFNSDANPFIFATLLDKYGDKTIDKNAAARKVALLQYLFNKFPESLRHNLSNLNEYSQLLDLVGNGMVRNEEEGALVDQYVVKLQKLFEKRKTTGYGQPLIGFHTSRAENVEDDLVNVSSNQEQTNINAPAGLETLGGGSKFFSFDLKKLYHRPYLHLIYASESQKREKIYDLAEQSAVSNAALEIISNKKLPAIKLTPEVMADIGGAYGTK